MVKRRPGQSAAADWPPVVNGREMIHSLVSVLLLVVVLLSVLLLLFCSSVCYSWSPEPEDDVEAEERRRLPLVLQSMLGWKPSWRRACLVR